ncbi:MAG: peptide MFS transporter [Planctomycetes bacterium]|nr:peptide MFS transporter [Planctomycetota bacterium]
MMFFAELWERFCYYGMRALLALYVVQQFHKPQDQASLSYGAFTALVYATGIFGGYIADRVMGYRRSILLGGLVMAAGEFALLIPNETAFLFGLAGIVVGNGLFKPNISTLVGKMYEPGDPRRDSGFTIFYMGINVGALIAPLLCVAVSYWMGTPAVGPDGSPLLENGVAVIDPEYRWGFGMAGAGMLLGIGTFLAGGKLLHGKGGAPEGREGMGWTLVTALGCLALTPLVYLLLANKEVAGTLLLTLSGLIIVFLIYSGVKLGTVVLQRISALIILLFVNALFWACFEQAGNSLNFFAQDHVGKKGLFEFEYFQSVNPVYIILLAPVFAWLWVWLARTNRNPSIPTKFGLGLVQVGLGFGVCLLAIQSFESKSMGMFASLFLVYLFHTTGELCISPVGLSMVTKLAPAHMTGMVMGAWFLSISMGNYVAGLFSALAGESAPEGAGAPLSGYVGAYTPILYMSVGAGLLLLILSKPINKLMHGVK